MTNDRKTDVYGIDLGTTYSAIAYINEYGIAEIIKNSEGESVTPSVVFFESSDNVTVGTTAKSAGQAGPEEAARVVDFVKTQMSGDTWSFEADGKIYGPVEVSSLILKRLAEDAKKMGGHEVKDVVITCPAYFGELERTRTRQAGELAGLNVLEILDEPVAAAINYGLNADSKGKNVVVYDLGGGTFDVTVIRIGNDPEKTEISVVCTEGDHQLGGKNWDDRIVQYYLEKFREETGTDIATGDPLEVHETMYDLRINAEKNKKTLTSRNEVPYKVSFDGEKARVELTREKFDELTADLLERTIKLTDKVLEDARQKGVATIDAFLLVGGSTKMPQVEAKIIEKYSGPLGIARPEYFDVDEAVAKGAAKDGEIIKIKGILSTRKPSGAEPTEEDITAVATMTGKTREEILALSKTTTRKVATKSYGIRALRGGTVEFISNLILKQSPVPVETTRTFHTADEDSDELPLAIYCNDEAENGAEPDMSTPVVEKPFVLPKRLPKDTAIDITFKLSDEGKLTVHAHEHLHGQSFSFDFVPEGALTREQLEEAQRKVGGLTAT